MAHEDPPGAQAAANPGYERRDVQISALVWLTLTVVLSLAAIFAVLWLLLAYLESQAQRADPQRSPLAQSEPPRPEPQLQPAPVEDLQALRQREDEILSSYGWVDQERQIVRIPVSRAMELALERGLPTPIQQEKTSESPATSQGPKP